MKLIRAHFKNFRLLRDLELEFSTDDDRKLTVIRAANESGKTTVMHGLQWALYGDAALPGGANFRLHPIDWRENEGSRVPIVVEVEFETTTVRTVQGEPRESRRRYRIVRSAFEDLENPARRASSPPRLFLLDESGARPIDAPESFLNEELPPELREVFFTDGDRALSFIEANVATSTKRGRVQAAIRSLLGLAVVEDAIKHVRKAEAEVNKKARQAGGGNELSIVATKLEKIDTLATTLEADFDEAKLQFTSFDEKVAQWDARISDALQKGDKEKLARDLDLARRKAKQLDEQVLSANKEHAVLFKSRALAQGLLAPVLQKAFKKLEELHDRGKIPNITIPVLEDRVAAGVCMCGEVLSVETAEGTRRLEYIKELIDRSAKADEIQELITSLYYEPRGPSSSGDLSWIEAYKKVVERRDALQTMRDDAGRELRSYEVQLAGLPDIDIQGLREALRNYKEQRDRWLAKQSSVETQLIALRRERETLVRDRDRLLREQTRGAQLLAELEVARDLVAVLEGAYRRITTEELTKVSTLMNKIFLEMIGADPNQGAIIQRAEISSEFDILVFGPNNRSLNPDRDLNGASRRALTLAFILALTKVSEVEAPNVIDTPLGMTSGYVKRSILRTAVRESEQLVLFLTHSEIAGCEDIIDDAASTIITVTNPTHFPKMLVNDPETRAFSALRCECDHRSFCSLCERKLDEDSPDMVEAGHA